jgi:aminocarboxymuconate-semialdehyde decarboxylase
MNSEGVTLLVVSATATTLRHECACHCRHRAQRRTSSWPTSSRAAPDRFRAGEVSLQEVAAAVDELRRCVLELGFLGIAIDPGSATWSWVTKVSSPFSTNQPG